MARSAVGAITLVDITDGTSPVAAYLTNENHTFSASAGGEVTSGERDAFSSQVNLFIGDAPGTRVPNTQTTLTTKGQYRIVPIGAGQNDSKATGVGWTFGIANTAAGTITVSGITTGSDSSGSLDVSVHYHNGASANNYLRLTLSVTKVLQGAGGVVITLTPTKQYFTADSDGNIPAEAPNTTPIQINYDSRGTTGNLTISTSTDGGAFTTKTATGNGVGDISGYNLDQSSTQLTGAFPAGITTGSDANFSFFVSSANVGTANTFALRVTAPTNGGGDAVTFVKVRQGTPGSDAIIVAVESNNDTVFRTGATNLDKTLTCTVYDSATGSERTDSAITYTWSRSGSGTVPAGPVYIGSGDRIVRDAIGDGRAANQTRANGGQTIIVGDEDVTNREQFTCTVTNVPD